MSILKSIFHRGSKETPRISSQKEEPVIDPTKEQKGIGYALERLEENRRRLSAARWGTEKEVPLSQGPLLSRIKERGQL